MNCDPVLVPTLPENAAQALDDAEALLAHHASADYESVVHQTFPLSGLWTKGASKSRMGAD